MGSGCRGRRHPGRSRSLRRGEPGTYRFRHRVQAARNVRAKHSRTLRCAYATTRDTEGPHRPRGNPKGTQTLPVLTNRPVATKACTKEGNMCHEEILPSPDHSVNRRYLRMVSSTDGGQNATLNPLPSPSGSGPQTTKSYCALRRWASSRASVLSPADE